MHNSILIYKRAWEEQSIDLLKACFSVDALYIRRPEEIAPVYRGLAEIERYWRENVAGVQNEVKFTVIRFIESDREIWLEWKSEAKFPLLLPDNLPFFLWGSMILDLNTDGKICRLTEYYFWDEARREMLQKARQPNVS